jgi:hypothetical protein
MMAIVINMADHLLGIWVLVQGWVYIVFCGIFKFKMPNSFEKVCGILN